MAERTIKPLYWLWIPLAWMAGQIMLELSFDNKTLLAIHSEYGPHEILQVFLLAGAAFLAGRIFFSMDRRARPWLAAWIALALFSCLYVLFEEISWGQTFFKWNTPEFWAEINRQRETNLHNTSRWLNQQPRLLLAIGVVTGGLIIPVLRKYKPTWVPTRFEIIYPPATLGLVAGIYLFVRLTEKAANMFLDIDLYARPSEIEELYLYYFVFLYLFAMYRRVYVHKAGLT